MHTVLSRVTAHLAVNRNGTTRRRLFNNVEKGVHQRLGRHTAVREKEIVVLEAGVFEGCAVVHGLVQAYDHFDSHAPKVREIEGWC